MKILLFTLVLLAAFMPTGFADDPKPEIPRDEVRDIPTLGVTELNEGTKAEELAGKIIKLRFKSRGKTPLQDDGGKQIGELDEHNPKTDLIKRVLIETPADAQGWYMRISTDAFTSSKSFVFVRVLGRVGDLVRVKALGRELRNASTKPEFIW